MPEQRLYLSSDEERAAVELQKDIHHVIKETDHYLHETGNNLESLAGAVGNSRGVVSADERSSAFEPRMIAEVSTTFEEPVGVLREP